MSDLLTHWAVMDHCRRIMPHIEGIESAFGEALASAMRALRDAGKDWQIRSIGCGIIDAASYILKNETMDLISAHHENHRN